MPRFELLAGNIVVGHTGLKRGDAPMGVAAGKLLPTAEYVTIQSSVIDARERSQAHPGLAVRLIDGPELPAQGGIHIIDYSVEPGIEDGIEVDVLGIGYPLYEELFPQHVAAYRTQFPRSE